MSTSSTGKTRKEEYGREYRNLKRKLKSLENRGYYVKGKYGELLSPTSLLPDKPKNIRKESIERIKKLSENVYKKVSYQGRSGEEGRKMERSASAKKAAITRERIKNTKQNPRKPLTDEEEQDLFDRAYQQRKENAEASDKEAEEYFNNLDIARADLTIVENFIGQLANWTPPEWWNPRMVTTNSEQIAQAIALLEAAKDGAADNEEEALALIKRLEENATTINDIIDHLKHDYEPPANAERIDTLAEILQGHALSLEQNAEITNRYSDMYWDEVA